MPPAASSTDQICPLCSGTNVRDYCSDRERSFLRCHACGLVFVPSSQFLSPEDEKRRYDLHRNSPDDEGYRRFLLRIFVPLNARLTPGSWGLDFGCGPGQVLAGMFRESGHFMAAYDRFYRPDADALKGRYDFITATEVLEHLRLPGEELARLWSCLKPGGVLGVMTRPVVDTADFPTWHYKNDRTHICFFSPMTLEWLAVLWGASLERPEKDIALFLKR